MSLNPINQPLAVNTTLTHYRIISKLGAGGMGEVWLAEDTRLGRKVALKLLPAEFTEDSERVRRFTQEAKAASALNHPNIISVYDIGESESGRFIVMEFVAGRTLRSVIAKDNSLETLFTLGAQMAKALSAAHAGGITHRDIKPDNIMVRDDGYVKMLDFGLARLLPTTASDPEAMTLAQQTTPGTVMGTLAYMSPEQASGQTVGSPSDVFALGIVLYELATGSHPFKSETMIGYLHAITSQVPLSLTSVRSHLPVALDDLILRMLEKDANQRPTAAEVAQALQEIEKYGSSNTLPLRIVAEKPKVSGAEDGFWLAVLPFKYRGSNANLEALSEGLSEEIVTGLSRFSYLRVVSRSSTQRYASETEDVRTVGKTLGARYVMEGSLRLAGSMLRVSVQLVDASTGAHLWAKTYDRQFRADDAFALQDDLVPRIVSTVADVNGVLPRSMSDVVCSKNPDELSPYEAVLRSFRYFDRVSAKELTAARSCLEKAVEKAPTYADAWAMLALLCVQDYAQGFNLQPDSLTRGTTAARRAVEVGPSNSLAFFSLAQAHFFQKELQPFRNAAERAVALNPMDGNSLAFVGELLNYVGDSERGLALATRAKEINPNHPGWFWYADFFHAYRQGQFRNALDLILKTNLPGHWGMQVGIAAAAGQLGEYEVASKAVRDLLKLRPDFSATVHDTFAKWFGTDLREQLIDGLRKAGLEIAAEEEDVHHSSSELRADEGFWIAVLPFKVVGSGTGLETLTLGMTEEIVTGFSRFSYLRVMSLGSTIKHSESGDLRQIGAELGARYVMEGSIRQAGSTVRLSVQLVDASTGAHLWAETFDRHFQPDQIFAMQDELIPRIVSTCADHFGVLARSISGAIRGKESSQLSPYEALMRGFGYHYRLNPQEHDEAREILEKAVRDAPNNADCWAMLSWIYSHEYGHGFNPQPGSLDRALAAARRAVDLAPTNHLAYQTLAVALFFRKERANCLSAAERAIALNPLDASNEAIFLITFVDDWERGCSLIRRAMDLNPYVPGWYRLILALNEYRKSNYREAIAEAVTANVPGIWSDIVLSAAHAQLGEQAAARNALSNLLGENSVDSARELLTKWFDADLVDNLVEGLRKAGPEMPAAKSTNFATQD